MYSRPDRSSRKEKKLRWLSRVLSRPRHSGNKKLTALSEENDRVRLKRLTREGVALHRRSSLDWGAELSGGPTSGDDTLSRVEDIHRESGWRLPLAGEEDFFAFGRLPDRDQQSACDGSTKREQVHAIVLPYKRRRLNSGGYTTVGTGNQLGGTSAESSMRGKPATGTATHTATKCVGATGNSPTGHLEVTMMHKPPTPKPRTGSDSGDLNLTCDSHPSPLPHLRDCSQNRGTASINTSHFSTQPHPHWLTAMPLFEDVNATSSRGGDVIVHTTTGLRDVLNGHLPRPKADTEGGHKIRSKPSDYLIMDLDHAEPGDIVLSLKEETEDGYSGHSEPDGNEIADLDDGETRGILFEQKADTGYKLGSDSELTSFYLPPNASYFAPAENDNEAANFTSTSNSTPTTDGEDARGAHSRLGNSQIIDRNSAEVGDSVFGSKADSDDEYNIHSAPDDNQIMDLDDGEAGEVIFGLKVDSGDEHGVHSELASLSDWPPRSPISYLSKDNDQIVDLSMETGEVVFGLKGDTDDEHDGHTVPNGNQLVDLSNGGGGADDGHSVHSEPDDNQVMGLDYAEAGGIVFGSNPDVRSEPDDDQVMDLDYAEAEDILFGSKPDNRHGVRSEPVDFSTTQLSHLTPFLDDDQITDLNDGETGDGFWPKTDLDHNHSIHSATVMDLDCTRTRGVIFGLKGGSDDEHSGHPATGESLSVDLDYAETVGNISRSKADTDNGHSGHSKLANYLWHSSPHLISLRDDNEIADLNYGETRDVLFKSKVDVDYEPSPNSGFVNFYPSPNTSRSPLAWNDSEATGIIQNPNSMPKADREDGHSVHSEPHRNRAIDFGDAEIGDIVLDLKAEDKRNVRSGPAGLPAAHLPHLTPSQDDDRIVDLSNGEVNDAVFGPMADSDDSHSFHSEPDDDQVMDLDYAEAEDILIGSEPDNRHGVRSEPNDDQIMDLNGEARGVNFGPAAASDGERSVHCEPDDQITDLYYAETGVIVFGARVDDNGRHTVHFGPVGLVCGPEKGHRYSLPTRERIGLTSSRPHIPGRRPTQHMTPTRRVDKDGITNSPISPFPDLEREIGEAILFSVDPRRYPQRRTRRTSPVLSPSGQEREFTSSPQVHGRPWVGQTTNGGSTSGTNPPVGDPSGRKPPGRTPGDNRTVELNKSLKDLAGLMQQVVAFNESNYQNIVVALQQVTSRLQESQTGYNEKVTPDGSQDRQSLASPLELKREVRQHSLVLLGRKDKQSPVPPPPEPKIIQTFNETGRGGPKGQPGKLRLDLEGPIRSSWNKRAARCFRKHFQQCGLYASWPKSDIEAAFLRHTETIRSHYQQNKGSITLHDIVERNDRASRKNRMNTLTEHRRSVCRAHKDMRRFEKYIDVLDHGGGMSEDEPDWRSASGKIPYGYFVVCPAWRSGEVTSWLQVIDNVYLAQRFTTDGRVTPGNWVRNRIRSTRVDRAAVPIKGLPANFYDKEWLRSLPPRKRRALGVIEAVDLTHTKEILRISARYANVKKRSDKPLDA